MARDGTLARHNRTALPESATMAKNQSAFFSFAVGTPHYCMTPRAVRHPFVARLTASLRQQGQSDISHDLKTLGADLVDRVLHRVVEIA